MDRFENICRILCDDAVSIIVTLTSGLFTTANSPTATFTVTLSPAPSANQLRNRL
jgi:hypothetical protein